MVAKHLFTGVPWLKKCQILGEKFQTRYVSVQIFDKNNASVQETNGYSIATITCIKHCQIDFS